MMEKHGIQNHSTFTGKERDKEKERSRGPFASERGNEPRSGIPYCSVYSYTYFGARYMDHELMTMWLSVDPMSDKYLSISPYAYCAWNPVKLVDPDGKEMFPTESAAAKVRANAVDMFGESRVGEIYNKGDEKHPNYAFLVYDYGKDKYERPSSKGVWAYKPDKCVDSKFDLFFICNI
jgi:RHS repeat-associated protein